MFESLRTTVVAPLAERWLAWSRASWRTLPLPSGSQFVHAEGPDPDRILLIGAGIGMGYGMESHDDALAGQIARQVSELTGRGVQVDVVVGERLTVEVALDNLSVTRLRELDVVLTTSGSLDRLLLLPMSVWARRTELFLNHFAKNAPASLRVLVVGIPELSKVVRVPPLLGVLADHWVRKLNCVLEMSCASRPYAQFIPFQPTEISGRDGTGRTYRNWAGLIAPSVAAAVQQHHQVVTAH
ncbi:MAG: hypothetical protein KF761_09145 [Salinibacterium sp.]|nr:hypothetical protein [Salinibacterium sp.]